MNELTEEQVEKTLVIMEEKGLLTSKTSDGQKIYSVTNKGMEDIVEEIIKAIKKQGYKVTDRGEKLFQDVARCIQTKDVNDLTKLGLELAIYKLEQEEKVEK